MITSETPETWQGLQIETANILRECGFAVELEKKVRTVRGEVEIDVYAEETVRGRKYVILCECKHWKERVPQGVIHAFRTCVSDIGANIGYLISTSGFQSGAFAASELTNIQLTTWRQFQSAFQEAWLEEHFTKQLAERLDALLTYTEPLLPAWFGALPEEERYEFMLLKERHDGLGHLVLLLSPYMRVFNRASLPELPLKDTLRDDPAFLQLIPTDVVDQVGYRQLFALLVAHGDAAIGEFRAIRDRHRAG